MLPSFFISHGSPMLALRPSPARDFLAGLGALLRRPRAIVVASGHWETEGPEVSSVTVNDTIHDFYGFPPALYAIRYPAPGSPELAERIAGLLREAGLTAEIDRARGLDHGAWVPLWLMYPEHDIPVLQLALQEQGRPAAPSAARPRDRRVARGGRAGDWLGSLHARSRRVRAPPSRMRRRRRIWSPSPTGCTRR